jgi:anti-sigma-K factor RskA
VTNPSERIDRERTELEAFRDGELPFFARRRVARRLRSDPALRRRLEALESLGALVREVDEAGPTPDLWAGIRLRLVQEDALRERAAEDDGGWLRAWRRPIGIAALGAVAAGSVALALLMPPEAAVPPGVVARPAGSVRWIDSRGNPMMVLRDDREATIIWIPDRES